MHWPGGDRPLPGSATASGRDLCGSMSYSAKVSLRTKRAGIPTNQVYRLIIFDTNALYGLHRQSPKFDLLMALKHSGSQAAGIPWMVREELVAKQVLEYVAAYESAQSATEGLNRKTPWGAHASLPPCEVETVKEHWRNIYGEVLSTLETSGENAKRALAREAYCEKPAKTNPKAKGGARDAAIWLSVIDYLRDNPEDEVYFVTDNSSDFGNGEDYPAPMLDDLDDMRGRLTLLASFEEVISRFTQKIDADIERIRDLLTVLSDEALALIGASAHATMKDGRYEGTRITRGSFEPYIWKDWPLPPAAVLRRVDGATGHKINESEWYTADVEWILVGLAEPTDQPYIDNTTVLGSLAMDGASIMPQVACNWHTKILFSTGVDEALTIVAADLPTALSSDDRTELQPLISKAAQKYLYEASAVLGAQIKNFRPGSDASSR